MNIKCGTDIIEVERIKKAIEHKKDSLKNRIFTEQEIEYCENKNVKKFESYAARFAAKEAIYKAISGELKDKYEIGYKHIEIKNDENGRPFVILPEYLQSLIENIDVSLSHIKDYATANVIIIFK